MVKLFLKRIYELPFTLDFVNQEKTKIVISRMDELLNFGNKYSLGKFSHVTFADIRIISLCFSNSWR